MADGVSIKTGSGFQSGFEGIAKGLIPNALDDIRAAAMGSTVAKNNEDIAKLQMIRQVGADVEAATRRGASALELAAIMSRSPEYLPRLGDYSRFLTYSNPNATREQRDASYGAAGGPFSGTQTGFETGERNQTQRTLGAAHIGAGPGYARVAEDKRQFNEKTHFISDPNTGLPMAPVRQQDIYNVGPVQPYNPEYSIGMRKPVEYGGPPGTPNMQRSLADYSTAFQGQAVPAPAPAGVLQQREAPMFVSPGPGQPAQLMPTGAAVAAVPPPQPGQPLYRPPQEFAPPTPPAPPAPTPVPPDLMGKLDALALTALARSMGLDDYAFTGVGNTAATHAVPDDYQQRRTAINAEIARQYQSNGGNAEAAVRTAMDGNMNPGWAANPGGRWPWSDKPSITPGPDTSYRPPQVNYTGQGGRVVPPTPPRGPTVSTRGNPNPQPAPAPTPTPAPTPKPAQAQPIARAPAGTADGTRMQTPDGRPGVVRGGLLFSE
jgi:hypothetical protein